MVRILLTGALVALLIATIAVSTTGMMIVQSVYALKGIEPGASEFAPGQQAKIIGPGKDPGASEFAPGQQAKIIGPEIDPGASEFSPGHLKTDQPTQ
jgi:hypothetical protein